MTQFEIYSGIDWSTRTHQVAVVDADGELLGERAFAWMSRCRRLAKDYERSLESSLAWAQLAACRFMMRRIARAATC